MLKTEQGRFRASMHMDISAPDQTGLLLFSCWCFHPNAYFVSRLLETLFLDAT